MKLFSSFRSKKNKDYYLIELTYSSLMWLSGNHKWFCRIWRKDWLLAKKSFGESYGRNKFEAYRLARKELY